MDIAPYLLLPFFQVSQTDTNINTGRATVVQADPSRIYLAILGPSGFTIHLVPEGYPAGFSGFLVPNYTNYMEFTFATHPGLVGLAWDAIISAPGHVQVISIDFKPEY